MKRLLLLLIALLLISLFASLIALAPTWTGFGHKTLWDWMSLILIPAVIAFGGAWYKFQQDKLAHSLEEQRREEERALQLDRLREEVLQKYLDRMTELMLSERLRDSKPGDEVQSVARARTLTALSELDGIRKGVILRFLVEAGLIGKSKRVIRLQEADLSEAHLQGANLVVRPQQNTDEDNGVDSKDGASFRKANLQKANLRKAKLVGTDMYGANLAEADLSGANLGSADLRAADMTNACIQGASLGGANLSRAKLCHANLCKVKFGDVDLLNADLTGADLRGADLRHVKNLTQEQINAACGDKEVKLRREMTTPPAWVSNYTLQTRPNNHSIQDNKSPSKDS